VRDRRPRGLARPHRRRHRAPREPRAVRAGPRPDRAERAVAEGLSRVARRLLPARARPGRAPRRRRSRPLPAQRPVARNSTTAAAARLTFSGMATIRKEMVVRADAAAVWDAVRDVGALHERLVPGFVVDTKLEPGARVVTFANGMVARELIVTVDD